MLLTLQFFAGGVPVSVAYPGGENTLPAWVQVGDRIFEPRDQHERDLAEKDRLIAALHDELEGVRDRCHRAEFDRDRFRAQRDSLHQDWLKASQAYESARAEVQGQAMQVQRLASIVSFVERHLGVIVEWEREVVKITPKTSVDTFGNASFGYFSI